MTATNASRAEARDGAGRSPYAHRLSIVLALLFAVSLTVNAILVRTAAQYYATTNAIRLDPVGLKVYAPDRVHPPDARPMLVFFGDSRALMWGRPGLPGYTVVNRGIGFQTTAQILARLDGDVTPLHPDVVVLEAGINDLKSISDFPERRAEIVADCKANLERIVSGCRSAGAKVVLTSIFELGDVSIWKRPFWSDDVGVAVREVNAYLPTLAHDGVTLFDANRTLDDGNDRVKGGYQLDYLHLSPPGYVALTQALVPLLSALPR
jgi:lysophospholipase L1-like esterase